MFNAAPQGKRQRQVMASKRIDLHLISDATGETLNSLARACLSQYEGITAVQHRWPLIRSRFQLDRVLDGIEHEPGPVLYTLTDRSLRTELESFCQRHGLPAVSVLDPTLDMLSAYVGATVAGKPGRQYVLDADYFRRIDAMHYVLAHDDGQGGEGIIEADVILVGVSRSSKTPTSFYLANRGIKAANVPLIPGVLPPSVLDRAERPIIGLTIAVDALIEIRRHRLKMIGAPSTHVAESTYIDPEEVRRELIAAKRFCASRGWPVIDVTRRSIEETATTVIQLMETWERRRADGVRPAGPSP
jgi:regulator of PEP synthase PpsR (kinase-PPPase family)